MEGFEVGFRLNRNFNHLVAIYFTAEGGGAALLLAALFFKQTGVLLTGLLMVLAGVVALLLDLGRPTRFWRSIVKPDRSWISRGSIFVGALVILSAVYTVFPGIRPAAAGEALRLLTALLCLLTISYTGLLIASFTAVPAWNRHQIPQLFCLHSASTGLVVVRLTLHLAGIEPGAAVSISLLEVLALAPTLGVTYAYYRFIAQGGAAEQEAARILVRGEMKPFFVYGAILGGLALPLLLAVASYFGSGTGFWNSGGMLAVAALARAAGDFCYRYSVLKSGVYEPVLS